METISQKMVATFEYGAYDEQGNMVDNSRDSGPLSYVHGEGKIVPGLERALEGKQAGDTFAITLAPSEAYGERQEGLLHHFTRTELSGLGELKIGMQLQTDDGNKKRILTIANITNDNVTLDENHPLAGRTIRFDIHVLAVREATEEELETGQAYDVACNDDCSTCASNMTTSDGDSCGCGCSNH